MYRIVSLHCGRVRLSARDYDKSQGVRSVHYRYENIRALPIVIKGRHKKNNMWLPWCFFKRRPLNPKIQQLPGRRVQKEKNVWITATVTRRRNGVNARAIRKW